MRQCTDMRISTEWTGGYCQHHCKVAVGHCGPLQWNDIKDKILVPVSSLSVTSTHPSSQPTAAAPTSRFHDISVALIPVSCKTHATSICISQIMFHTEAIKNNQHAVENKILPTVYCSSTMLTGLDVCDFSSPSVMSTRLFTCWLSMVCTWCQQACSLLTASHL